MSSVLNLVGEFITVVRFVIIRSVSPMISIVMGDSGSLAFEEVFV